MNASQKHAVAEVDAQTTNAGLPSYSELLTLINCIAVDMADFEANPHVSYNTAAATLARDLSRHSDEIKLYSAFLR